ncbi:MAG: repeat-containing protein [Acidobacteriota bacterium]|nr:repeat-containing protein [Acidobacteriota bacterium]
MSVLENLRASVLGLAAGVCLASGALAASPAKLALAHQRLELPGVPVQTLAVDLDRDGLRDLAVVVASTSWGEVGIEEPMQVDDEGTFVDVLTVVPAVLDRRELLLFLGAAAGAGGFGSAGYAAEPVRFELPSSVHAIAAGPPAAPLVAWTDDGIAAIVLASSATAEGQITRELSLVPRIAAPTIFTGSSSFLASSGLTDDLDGDGDPDLLVPVAGGLAVHLSTPEGVSALPASLVAPPDDAAAPGAGDPAESRASGAAAKRRQRREREVVTEILLPRVVDLSGDRRPDLLYRDSARDGDGVRVRLNLGEGRFGPAFDPLPGWSSAAAPAVTDPADEEDETPSREVVWLGDLDGDGPAEVVTSQDIPNPKDSMRAELAEAKRPRARIRVHALGADGRWNPAPKAEFTVEGYVFEGGGRDDEDGEGGGGGFSFPSGVRDLDGDGRLDLVALTLDFSLFEAMRVLATKSIQLGLDFGIYRQGDGLSFRPVTGLDLAGELRLRLDSLALGQLSSFAGDFDGDGRADFVQLGRGRKVTIHRGQPGARYAPEPDLVITLEREPLDVALVTVADLDGDGRSDISVTQPIGGKAIGARAALDLYLSAATPSAGAR